MKKTRQGRSIVLLVLLLGIVSFGHAETITMTVSNVSWLNPMWGTPATAPTAGNDYVMAYVGTSNPGVMRVSPAGSTGSGNTTFPGNSITIDNQCRFLVKQLAGETASINGGSGNLVANNGSRISFACNGQQSGVITLDVGQLIFAGSTLFDFNELSTVNRVAGTMTGTGDVIFQKEVGKEVNRSLITIQGISDYTGNITLKALIDLDFDADYVFAGSLALQADSKLKVDQALTFEYGKLIAGGTNVEAGTYSGSTLTALNTTLGATYFVDGGGMLTVQPPVFVETYNNPVIPGFYPDPSICRVGDDYYLVNSTFEYFPGVPIFHSKDMVNWRQIGHCLTRNSQLPLGQCGPSGGIYAPTIRYHDGTFYMVVTNYASGGNAIFTATDPAGPWSEPIWLGDWNCDPSLLFDNDGTIYYTAGSGSKIYQSVYNPATKKIGPLQIIFETGFAEAPHLYNVYGTYYLMLAEGGTGYGHKVTIARSSSPWGPFEYYSGNPILTHSNLPDHPIQACGHGDLVQTPAGDWWIVFLGLRPKGGKFTHLGRETFLAPVKGNAAGWPVVNQTGRVELVMEAPNLPACPWPQEPARDEFTDTSLKFAWNYLRNPIMSNYNLTARPGFLRLMGTGVTLNETKSPTFTGQRQTLFECRVKTRMEFNPAVDGEEAGLTTLGNNKNHFDLGVTRMDGQRCIFLRKRLAGEDKEFISRPIPAGPVELAVKATDLTYTFYYQANGESIKVLATAETKSLSREVIGGFTGTYIGIYATGNGTPCTVGADFDWLEIIEGPGETLPSPIVDAGQNILTSLDKLPAKIAGSVSDPENDLAANTWTILKDDSAYPGTPAAAAMQMYNRNAYTADPAYTNLVQDWIGTDARQIGDPLVLTISGLPAGTYIWTSYHHDTQDQTGQFDVIIHDADGPQTILNVDITNGASLPFSNLNKRTCTIVSDGSPVSLIFDKRPFGSDNTAFFVMNGFELVKGADSLKVDFGTSDSPVQAGYQAYTAKHETFSSFTPQDFSAFGATVTVNPDWGLDTTTSSVTDTTTNLYAPTADFTTDTVGTYKIRLSSTDANLNTGWDLMEIRVYANTCQAAANNPNGPYVPPVYDLNGDCKQNLADFAIFASQWLKGKVLDDLATFASQWLENSGQVWFTSPVVYNPLVQP